MQTYIKRSICPKELAAEADKTREEGRGKGGKEPAGLRRAELPCQLSHCIKEFLPLLMEEGLHGICGRMKALSQVPGKFPKVEQTLPQAASSGGDLAFMWDHLCHSEK